MNPYIYENQSKIISFSLLQVECGRERLCNCQTPHFELDSVNRIVVCKDCGAVIDSFDALLKLGKHMDHYAEYQEKALDKARAYAEMADKEFRRRMKNRAFKEMDAHYHEGLMPICPVCGELFDPSKINCWSRPQNENIKEG